jgi:hypothetical protein
MDNIFIIAAVISVIYLIAKFLEMRIIEKENKPLKLLIRDSILVYFSVIFGYFIVGQINPIIHGGSKQVTKVFTDNPGF